MAEDNQTAEKRSTRIDQQRFIAYRVAPTKLSVKVSLPPPSGRRVARPALAERCSRLAAFIDLVVVEEGDEVHAVGQPARSLVTLQLLGGAVVLVAPAALDHELVPDQHLLVIGAVSVGKAPSPVLDPGPQASKPLGNSLTQAVFPI